MTGGNQWFAWVFTFCAQRVAVITLPPRDNMPSLRLADLGMPHTRAMGDGLFELRLKAGEGIAPIFYCTRVGRRIVMLHQFNKKTEKTPAKELLAARTRMKELVNGTNP